MPQMFTSTLGLHEKHFCPQCADHYTEVRSDLDKAQEASELIVTCDSQVISGKVCDECQRPIATVPTSPGVYKVSVTLKISITVEMQEESATATEIALEKLIRGDVPSITDDLESRALAALSTSQLVYSDYTFEMGEASQLPPCPSLVSQGSISTQ